MRMIPTEDTEQYAQIKSNHRSAGIKRRTYVGEDREYETGGNKGHNPRDSRIGDARDKDKELKGNQGTER
eukprot:1840251-Pleurochrysis_carterae.AAC.1